jgi:hypothetical protein
MTLVFILTIIFSNETQLYGCLLGPIKTGIQPAMLHLICSALEDWANFSQEKTYSMYFVVDPQTLWIL